MITENEVVEYLTESHLEHQGGYPFDHEWHKDSLIVASIDHDDSSCLLIYTRPEVNQWIEDANEYAKDAEDDGETCSAWDAIGETMPVQKRITE